MDRPLLATLLRRLHLRIREAIHDDLAAAGFGDLAPAHVYIFQTPGPDGARPTELAARTNMTKQAMNHHLAYLEAHGYLARVAAEDGDGRGKVVRLTARGRRVERLMRESAARIEEEWESRIGVRTMAALRKALAVLDAGTATAPASRR